MATNHKVTLESGAELDITLASFSEGFRLFRAVSRECEKVKLEIGLNGQKFKSFSDIPVTDDLINTMKNLVARVIGSDEVIAALWPCMARASINNQRVTPDIFESDIARGDFLTVAREVLFFNLTPFFGGLASSLKGIVEKLADSRKSE